MSTAGIFSGAAGGMAAGSAFGVPGAIVGGGLGALVGGKDGGGGGSSMDAQAAVAQQNLEFQKQVYENERRLTAPQKERIQAMALSDQPLYYDKMAAQINKQFSSGDRAANYLNYGTNLNFGQNTANMQANALQRKQALADAYQSGLQARTNLLTQSAGMGNAAGAAGGVGSAYGSLSNIYGHQADVMNQAQQGMWGNIGSAVGNLAQYYKNANLPQTPAPQINPESINRFSGGVPGALNSDSLSFHPYSME